MRGQTRHDHRFEPTSEDQPIFEDGAAIFHEVCRWQPTKAHHDDARDEIYHEPKGPECGEERYIEFDAAYIKRDDGKFFPIPEDWSDVPETTENVWEHVEQALYDDEADLIEVDPDPDHGRVVVEHNCYRLVYAADPATAKETAQEDT